MTVAQLIACLRKLDQRAIVAWRDHDQSVNEVNAFVRSVDIGEDELHADEYIAKVLAKYGATSIVVLQP